MGKEGEVLDCFVALSETKWRGVCGTIDVAWAGRGIIVYSAEASSQLFLLTDNNIACADLSESEDGSKGICCFIWVSKCIGTLPWVTTLHFQQSI